MLLSELVAQLPEDDAGDDGADDAEQPPQHGVPDGAWLHR